MDITNVQLSTIRVVGELIDKWNRENPRNTVSSPMVLFYGKGKCAGFADSRGQYVRFHLGLLPDNWQTYRDEVIPHEVAHCIAAQVYGLRVQPHGREWKSICYNLTGRVLPRCHRMDTSKVKARRTRYVQLVRPSDGEVLELPAKRYKSAVSIGIHFRCPKTKERLAYKGDVLK